MKTFIECDMIGPGAILYEDLFGATMVVGFVLQNIVEDSAECMQAETWVKSINHGSSFFIY